jgi:hypothetical protein
MTAPTPGLKRDDALAQLSQAGTRPSASPSVFAFFAPLNAAQKSIADPSASKPTRKRKGTWQHGSTNIDVWLIRL